MKCGEAIFVKDMYGAYDCRFIAQCNGLFMLISRAGDYRNGYILPDWRAVLRELVALAVPAKMVEHIKAAEGHGSGQYVNFPLTYPLSVASLASLLGVPADDIRAQLADLAVAAE